MTDLFSRSGGVLLHVTSLPGPFGIGDLGPESLRLVPRLSQAAQRHWQLLPVGPTGYGNSPYQASSSFAGNPLLISPEMLLQRGLVEASECDDIVLSEGPVDYEAVTRNKLGLLRRAASRFGDRATGEMRERYDGFCVREGPVWLDDYCLYVALKTAHHGQAWTGWDHDLARRTPAALVRASTDLAEPVEATRVIQFLFREQWRSLHETAAEHDVELVGDLPLYVSHDSADVWANPDLFQLDDRGEPTVVAGVPPDYFSATGQKWGNPIFDWEEMANQDFRWWRSRVAHSLELFDRLRIDHFRGIVGYWAIPADEPTAVGGRWLPGPGAELLEAVGDELGRLPLVAEDLGVITPEVVSLRTAFDLPGMRVAQFGFDAVDDAAMHHPDNYPHDVWAYTGTHDNDTTTGWFWEGNPRRRVWRLKRSRRALYRRAGGQIPWGLMEMVARSRARTAIFPVQDILGLGTVARMNTPGTTRGNWEWRLRSGQLDDESLARLKDLTRESGRIAPG